MTFWLRCVQFLAAVAAETACFPLRGYRIGKSKSASDDELPTGRMTGKSA
jgi:hypothetical protein